MKKVYCTAIVILLACLNSHSQPEPNKWNIRILVPDSHRPWTISIGGNKILHSGELGEIVFVGEEVKAEFIFWEVDSNLYIGCTKYPANCLFASPKKIKLQEAGILDKKFSLVMETADYKFKIKVNPKDGRYIVFHNGLSFKKSFGYWYQQDHAPFDGNNYPPTRIE